MKEKILVPAFPGHELYVDATDGDTIMNAVKTWGKAIFVASEFNDHGLNKKSRPTKYAPLSAYELVGEGTYLQMLKEVCIFEAPLLKQSQIVRFLKDNPDKFGKSAVVFFFFKKEKSWWDKIQEFIWPSLVEIFVARVNLMTEMTYIFPATLEDKSVWNSERHPHYVITTRF